MNVAPYSFPPLGQGNEALPHGVYEDEYGDSQKDGKEHTQEFRDVLLEPRIQNPEDEHSDKPDIGHPNLEISQVNAIQGLFSKAGKNVIAYAEYHKGDKPHKGYLIMDSA